MPLRIECPECFVSLKVGDKHAGRVVACPKCQAKISVPPLRDGASGGSASQSRRPSSKSTPRDESGDFWDQPLDNDFDDSSLEDEDSSPRPDPRRKSGAHSGARRPAPRAQQPVWIPYAIGFGVCLVVLTAVWALFLRHPKPDAATPFAQQSAEQTMGINTQSQPAASAAASKDTANVAGTTPPAPSKSEVGGVPATSSPAQVSSTPAPASSPLTASAKLEQDEKGSQDAKPDEPALASITSQAGRSSRKMKFNPALTSSASPPDQAPKQSLEELIERVGDSVVLIKVLDKSGKEIGLGAGFVVDSNGLVATCFHVIRGGTDLRVEFRDGDKSGVKGIRQSSPEADLAILELDNPPANIKPVPLAANPQLRPGQEVIAIGHPSGLTFSPTRGIVSGVHKTSDLPAGARRFLSRAPKDQQWIQTDAVISPGNSGGPLFDRNGEVIGVNSWVSTETRFAFAVHVQHLAKLKTELFATAKPLSEGGKSGGALAGADELDAEVEEVMTDFRRAAEEFMVDFKQAREKAYAGDPSDLKALYKRNPAKPYAAKLLQIGEKKPKTPTAFQALSLICFVLSYSDPDDTDSIMQRATRLLLDNHLQEEDLGDVAISMRNLSHRSIRGFLYSLIQKSPHKQVQGSACFALAGYLEGKIEEAKDEKAAERLDKEILALLKRVEKEFADVPYEEHTLAEIVKPLLFEKEHLAVGAKVPEIIGADIDGQEFKLSDYKGQVILLEFWADWCPYCRNLYPHERKLVKTFEGQPFAILGVNCDERERLEKVQQQKQTTWRSWHDGPEGPIASQWNVNGFPTMYLIDRTGTIRYKGNFSPEWVEKAVQSLIAEGAAGQSGSRGTARKSGGGRRGR